MTQILKKLGMPTFLGKTTFFFERLDAALALSDMLQDSPALSDPRRQHQALPN